MAVQQASLRELTLRGVILGACITLVFTASNVYLGLKVGLTFASSIPAAVISMAVLRSFPDSSILENNIVQTQASAAGTLSAIIFVLPALLMMSYWSGFPFLQTALICACGGILGVVFTVPLRRALVVNSDLPYPEGVAAAEILRVGQRHADSRADAHGDGPSRPDSGLSEHPGIEEKSADGPGSSAGLREILSGGLLAGGFSLLTGGFRLAADSFSYWFSAGSAIFHLPFGFSFALAGAGYLVGISSGIAMLVGVFFAWEVAVPWLTHLEPLSDGLSMADHASAVWVAKVRLIGAGMIAVAALWALITLIRPMVEGMRVSIAMLRRGHESRSDSHADTDLSPWTLGKTSTLMLLLLGATFWSFVADSGLPFMQAWALVLISTAMAFLLGFMVAAACGYMAGLVGSSASPISGIAVIAILSTSLVLIGVAQLQGVHDNPEQVRFFTALALFCTSVVVAIAAISNDNLQDLKTGWLIGATPWKQQLALMIGCVIGAVTIPPVLDLLYNAYGFLDSLPRADMDVSQALAAPQASLMITIANGLFSHTLDWTYIIFGICVGIAFILFDIALGYYANYRMPPLAVAMGVYLPPSIASALFAGALISWLVRRGIKRRARAANLDASPLLEAAEHKGTLFASGLIVGESLVGVFLAVMIVVSMAMGGSDAPLALVGPEFAPMADIMGISAFALMCMFFVRRLVRS